MAVVEITHPDRVLFPDDGITKRRLADYYRRVAPAMVPHLRGRPLMLQRFPRGIAAPGFYHKDVGPSAPPWVRQVEVPKEGGSVAHVVCDDKETLIYLANLDCITPHVWLSRAERPRFPDRLVVDLDPSAEDDFGGVRAAARAVGRRLSELGLVPYVQTTGSRGLHVTCPLVATAPVEEVLGFARSVAAQLAHEDPEHLTVEGRKSERGGRVYLDVMRNGYAQTVVAPYAVRALAGAPVATPVEWDELGATGMSARRWTLANMVRRLAQRADPWARIDGDARPLPRADGA